MKKQNRKKKSMYGNILIGMEHSLWNKSHFIEKNANE